MSDFFKKLLSIVFIPLISVITRLLFFARLRTIFVRFTKNRLSNRLLKIRQNSNNRPKIEEQRTMLSLAIVDTVDRLIGKGGLSPEVSQASIRLWARALLTPRGSNRAVKRFNQQHGCDPPWFLTISPGHACNLACQGCYASSGQTDSQLSWSSLDRIITEAKELWDIKLVVLSGGEPMLYRSEGKDVLDIVEKHSDLLFLMFTNGTLVSKQLTERLAELGNLTPAFSVEGMAERTDSRRGSGVFETVVNAMDLTGRRGVPFGISVTVTHDNCEEVISKEFLDFFFGQHGAFYGFYFQYTPIGRGFDVRLMPTPAQRIEFFQKTWDIVRQDRLFLIDFWNHGPLVDGCISAGRGGGYIYIDWNGKVMPCVFAPFSAVNINQVYTNGGTLNDVWKQPFFQAIRDWQRTYGYGRDGLARKGNLLRPCPFRDHHALFSRWIEKYHPEPEDDAAREIVDDNAYRCAMVDYGDSYAAIADDIWNRDYLGHS